ncbi:hypothetical protein H8356DRAFT_1324423 [Neocallimastix lanati (nom. inval.)]|nr:hypothetical protein H8356DRAFT_1324423 [Neocallimastix sp. JGI-2020a]
MSFHYEFSFVDSHIPKIGGDIGDVLCKKNNNFVGNRVDTGTLPRIGGPHITTDENKYSYIITAVEDDIVRVLMEKEKEVNRALTLDECEDKLRQLKKVIITPNESVCDFNTRFLELYDQLDFNDNLLYLGRIYEMVAMANVDNLEDACRLAEKFESIINESVVGNEMWGSYTTNNRNNYNSVIKYSQIKRSNYKNNFSN